MTAAVNLNGRVADAREATISVFDHGFLYGEGVYETLRTYSREPFLFDRHMRRLRKSAAMIRLSVPLADADMLSRIRQTMAKAGDPGEAYIRILLTRGIGELTYDPAACPTPSVVIIVKPYEGPASDLVEQGARICLVSVMRNHPASVNPLIKSNNLLNNALGMQEALARGCAEGLMRNYRGELAECTQSNIFIVCRGAALTPPLEAGLLAGITREFLFELGPELGIPVRERVLREEDLYRADETFITSTTRELLPIVQVEDRPIGTGRPGPITRKLLEGYRRKARELSLAGARSG